MATFELHLSPSETSPVMIRAEGELPEYGQVWIWDMLYARVMHELGDCSEARELREQLELWAVNMSSKIFQPFDHIRSKGHLDIDPKLKLGEVSGPAQRVRLEVHGAAGELPSIRMETGELSRGLRARIPLALAQHFINANELFAKELPIHILAFRKYYSDVRTPDAAESLEEAPMFAIQKALEYFQSANRGTVQ
ncbi:hypothetical protein [Thioalkalivibrio sulfidiphilus]|uniref:hypothetical protein n=1 Tax=Thioalkalivibrio sulfidiphilus TaxID=1033854 RepID=UPI003B315126